MCPEITPPGGKPSTECDEALAAQRARLLADVRPMLVRSADEFRRNSQPWLRTTGELRQELTERLARWFEILRSLCEDNPDAAWGEVESICSEVTAEIRFLVELSCGQRAGDEWCAPGWMEGWPAKLAPRRAQMPAASMGLLDAARSRIVLVAIEKYFAAPNHSQDAESVPALASRESENTASFFSHSPDYRSITYRSQSYVLTDHQTAIVRMLHEEYKRGNPELGQAYILEELEIGSDRLRDTFKNANRELWGSLIVSGKRRGTRRLNLPDPRTTPPKRSA